MRQKKRKKFQKKLKSKPHFLPFKPTPFKKICFNKQCIVPHSPMPKFPHGNKFPIKRLKLPKWKKPKELSTSFVVMLEKGLSLSSFQAGRGG